MMRGLATAGALLCALGVALGAVAMHAALPAHDHERLALAASFAFAQGVGLAALAPGAGTSRARRIGLCAVLAGTILFAGSLVLAAFAGVEPRLAPIGGSLQILGWLAVAVGFAKDGLGDRGGDA